MHVVKVGLPRGAIRAKDRHGDHAPHRSGGGLGFGQARIARSGHVIIGADHEHARGEGLVQPLGHGFQVASIKSYRHRPARGHVDAGGCGVAFGHA